METLGKEIGMRITTLILAASLALSFVGNAMAQGAPGGGGSGGNEPSQSDKGTSKPK